jgi:hypothetical protein
MAFQANKKRGTTSLQPLDLFWKVVNRRAKGPRRLLDSHSFEKKTTRKEERKKKNTLRYTGASRRKPSPAANDWLLASLSRPFSPNRLAPTLSLAASKPRPEIVSPFSLLLSPVSSYSHSFPFLAPFLSLPPAMT